MLKTIVIFCLTRLFFSAGEPSVSLVLVDDITNVTVIGTVTSNTEVTNISWKRRVHSSTTPLDLSITSKYRTSGTFSSPVLTIFDMQNERGTYIICTARNNYSTDYAEIYIPVREEPKTPKMDTILIILGTVLGILFVIAILVDVLTNRKQDHTSQSYYEERDMRTDENHRYGNTSDRCVYYNSEEEVKIDDTNTGYDYCSTEGMLERYDVSELKNNLKKKDLLQPRLTAEFRMLASPIQEYDYIESDIQRGFERPDDNRIITIQNGDKSLMISDISNLLNIENFWNMIYERKIQNIIFLAKKGEIIPELSPTLDESIEIDYLVIDMESAEKIHHSIQLLTFKLYNKKTRSSVQIEIFKSCNSKYTDKYPAVDELSCLVDKLSDRKGNVLLLGSKSFGLRFTGVLYVCLDVVRAMKKEGIFNLLESAITAKQNISNVFRDFEEYEMCYTVIEYYLEHYLHHVDTYDHID